MWRNDFQSTLYTDRLEFSIVFQSWCIDLGCTFVSEPKIKVNAYFCSVITLSDVENLSPRDCCEILSLSCSPAVCILLHIWLSNTFSLRRYVLYFIDWALVTYEFWDIWRWREFSSARELWFSRIWETSGPREIDCGCTAHGIRHERQSHTSEGSCSVLCVGISDTSWVSLGNISRFADRQRISKSVLIRVESQRPSVFDFLSRLKQLSVTSFSFALQLRPRHVCTMTSGQTQLHSVKLYWIHDYG